MGSSHDARRRPRRRPIPTTELTPADVLAARAEVPHELRVRTIGPAIVIVAERDAPLRMECLANGHAEREALSEYTRRDPWVAELLNVYFAHGEEHLYQREDAHAERLEQATNFSAASRR